MHFELSTLMVFQAKVSIQKNNFPTFYTLSISTIIFASL